MAAGLVKHGCGLSTFPSEAVSDGGKTGFLLFPFPVRGVAAPSSGGLLSRAALKHLSGCASAVEPFLDGWRARGRHEPSQTADAPHVQAFSKCADGRGTESE